MNHFLKIVGLSCSLFCVNFFAQLKPITYPDSLFSTYYHQRNTLFKTLPINSNDIVFLGNSITDGNEWSELFADNRLKNRGISGDTTEGVINRLDDITKNKPAKVFLLIGINDLSKGKSVEAVLQNIFHISAYLKQESPNTKLYIQSILPVNAVFGKFEGHTNKSESINQINEILNQQADKYGYTFINLNQYFRNNEGKMDTQFTNDGLHLLGNSYQLWKHIVYPFVFDLQKKPALIPLPQQLVWKEGKFPLYKSKTIFISDKSLTQNALYLKNILSDKGLANEIKEGNSPNDLSIELNLNPKISSTSEEGYQLSVSEKKIVISAKNNHGIFNALQTLRQLMRDGTFVDACEIIDQPAFSWRGYLIDVGRNYMSPDLLKQQIEMMSYYKLNVFHFHATEDIAWRLASKQYPQLNAPEYMLRNKGMYYTEQEIKDLIDYCKQRHILFVPEIDMPGHSEAFKKAMKTDMQSEEGMAILKNVLKEFCATYDVKYIHIGADEVKITNNNFVPEMTTFIESLGKKVIGWQPGGNFTPSTIRQLWMDDNAHLSTNNQIQLIDSKHLYINHMDPLEAVTTIFNRKITNNDKGDSINLGGTICMWHDRAVAKEEDVFRMNPVYPSILAFAERSWVGKGQQGWIANISDGDKTAFVDFENRLLDNKKEFFQNKIFNYQKQSNITWNLYGPYQNNGDLKKEFAPEKSNWKESKTTIYKEVTGGTIVLKHWWAPLIKGAIDNPKENSTWYATTKIWANEDGQKPFWIGFNNLSRSPATDSLPLNEWDAKSSKIWINGNVISPPNWLRAGQKGNSEIPLVDEGYEYRQPTYLNLKKGWNTILVKAPIGTFKGKDWQNPVKWMFTFVPVEGN